MGPLFDCALIWNHFYRSDSQLTWLPVKFSDCDVAPEKFVTRLLWSQIQAARKTWRRHPLRGGYGITSSELCKNEEDMNLMKDF